MCWLLLYIYIQRCIWKITGNIDFVHIKNIYWKKTQLSIFIKSCKHFQLNHYVQFKFLFIKRDTRIPVSLRHTQSQMHCVQTSLVFTSYNMHIIHCVFTSHNMQINYPPVHQVHLSSQVKQEMWSRNSAQGGVLWGHGTTEQLTQSRIHFGIYKADTQQ